MIFLKKYISTFLLLVFTWVVLPPSFVHEFFANHHDTECLTDHSPDTTQVESVHKHCDVFKTITPLYDAPTLTLFEKPVRRLIAEFHTPSDSFYFNSSLFTSNSRGPPVF